MSFTLPLTAMLVQTQSVVLRWRWSRCYWVMRTGSVAFAGSHRPILVNRPHFFIYYWWWKLPLQQQQ